MNSLAYLDQAPAQYTTKLCSRQLEQIKECSSIYRKASVAITIAHKDQHSTLCNALKSALMQTLVIDEQAQIVVLDDSSEQQWPSELINLLDHPSITVLKAECGSPARARNLLLDWADNSEYIKWVARLDADDELVESNSVEVLFKAGEAQSPLAVLGSNLLKVNGEVIAQSNIPNADKLLNRSSLLCFIERFCFGQQSTELPSCNLLLKVKLGLRYPNIRSAEDHWLVARLLMQWSDKVAIVSEPYYCVYSLNGTDTESNKANNIWKEQRKRLAVAAGAWLNVLESNRKLLGLGMEGVVWCQHNQVVKQFYPWSISDADVFRLQKVLAKPIVHIPTVVWFKRGNQWCYSTENKNLKPVPHKLPLATVSTFLSNLYEAGICALNVKRDNLMLNATGQLVYIDVGNDIQSLTTPYFLDMAARLYSIAILGNDDEEFVRRKSWRREVEALQALPDFETFYLKLISGLHQTLACTQQLIAKRFTQTPEVTLLIKACAQDAQGLFEQVAHIVTQLSHPVTFASVQLLVDEYSGPFLRQYADPDLELVKQQARQLLEAGLIDSWITAPQSLQTMVETYRQWFGESNVKETHTAKNAPLYPQIWAFSQVVTRYVLQCDCDVLIGRKNWQHDYLADMLYASEPLNVQAVGFNIAKQTDQFLEYFGCPGEFPPEVRFGLLDLHRIRRALPMSNSIDNGRFTLTWHRAIQAHQSQQGTCSVRGGDPASFYVHPRNEDKADLGKKPIRDLIAQGIVPVVQQEAFDLVINAPWQYPMRTETVVFLLKGRLTPHHQLSRCLFSLQQQRNQSFGIILIDDASGAQHSWCYANALQAFNGRATLIRHSQRQGRMPNFLLAIEQVCQDSNTLIAVLDQDDCLMQDTIVDQLINAKKRGHDLIQMPMFRPNKPLKLYQPSYENPRQKAGANVWSHLRVFQKSLFERVPKSYFKRDNGEWIDTVTDYLTMLPMAELANQPVYLDTGYAYYHDRKNYSAAEKQRENQLIDELLNKPSLLSAVEPMPADGECHS